MWWAISIAAEAAVALAVFWWAKQRITRWAEARAARLRAKAEPLVPEETRQDLQRRGEALKRESLQELHRRRDELRGVGGEICPDCRGVGSFGSDVVCVLCEGRGWIKPSPKNVTEARFGRDT
jgi:Flp pilus assembly protein TadB